MKQGSSEYTTALVRWRELYTVKLAQKLTFEQAVELEALERRLGAAEYVRMAEWEEAATLAEAVSHTPFSVLADDYEETMLREAGNLGTWEP